LIDFQTVLTLSTTFFIITNPIGNSPAVLALIKDYPLERQRYIMMREGVIALLLALFFQYFGEFFLGTLMLKDYTIALCGGILLFMIGLGLIFPNHDENFKIKQKQEPFIVPIATPLLTGPGLLAMVMLNSRLIPGYLTLTVSLCVAWVAVGIVLYITPYLKQILGNKGMIALEQLMGMVLSMISTDMIVRGARLFVAYIQ